MPVTEKYPASWRLDHPDFRDIGETSYAKGVITEVKITPPILDLISTPPEASVYALREPLAFESLAKVELIGGETDYLPIFYHPKEQYWDTNAYEATEFDQEQGYFGNAWMSFRGGDEVVVMLKKGIPVAILGFADGNPKIGEAVIGVDTPAYSSGGVDYPAEFGYLIPFDLTQDVMNGLDITMKGPDGLPLGLIAVTEINDTIIPAGIITDNFGSFTFSYIYVQGWGGPTNEEPYPGEWVTAVGYGYLIEYYYIVGPAIFFVQSWSVNNIYGQDVGRDAYFPIWGVSRTYVGSFTEALYNQIRGGGSTVGSACSQGICGYLFGSPPPPTVKWGTTLPADMFIISNTLGSAHPLALPSFKARPHNPS